MSDNILDSVLNLEEVSYQAGFNEGEADGAKAGYAEGKIFGIEQGYQKGLEMGKLHGRALMLNASLSEPNSMSEGAIGPCLVNSTTSDSKARNDQFFSVMPDIPTLPENPRLKKHVETLLKLTDPDTLSVGNSDEAIDEFDDRMKKAKAKTKVIDKLIAEPYNISVSRKLAKNNEDPAAGSGNIEEMTNRSVRR